MKRVYLLLHHRKGLSLHNNVIELHRQIQRFCNTEKNHKLYFLNVVLQTLPRSLCALDGNYPIRTKSSHVTRPNTPDIYTKILVVTTCFTTTTIIIIIITIINNNNNHNDHNNNNKNLNDNTTNSNNFPNNDDNNNNRLNDRVIDRYIWNFKRLKILFEKCCYEFELMQATESLNES